MDGAQELTDEKRLRSRSTRTHVLLAKVDELLVVEVQVALNLEDGRLDATVVQVALDLLLWRGTGMVRYIPGLCCRKDGVPGLVNSSGIQKRREPSYGTNLLRVVVGDSNGLDKALVDKRLHCLPRVQERDVVWKRK